VKLMDDADFDKLLRNPVLTALGSLQAEFAVCGSSFVRYRPEVLPFAAVPEEGTEVDADELLAHGSVFFQYVLPKIVGCEFEVTPFSVLQMLWPDDLPSEAAEVGEVELGIEQSAEMVELTDVAFPGMFRPASPLLGRYVGIRRAEQLVAMAGERFRLPGLREISGVCTRPGHTGKGYAAHLIRRLLSVADAAERSFLHVAESNQRAVALYERMGFQRFQSGIVIRVTRRPQ
jgi:GNAT superfamily N-acetyltransferase